MKWAIAWIVALIGWISFASAQTFSPASAPVPAAVIQLEGEINDYTYRDLVRRIDDAKLNGAAAIILEIDSYGGLVTAGLETSRFIKKQDVPVVAFVRHKAISAGAMIALACDAIYMARHTTLGDAAPIAMGGDGLKELGATERAKIESPIVEDFRDSAERNGYNALLVESMVVLGRDVYYVQDKSGNKRFMSGEEWEKISDRGEWSPVIPDRNPVDTKQSLLTVNATVAKQVGLCRGIAESAAEVASAKGWRIVAQYSQTWGDQVIALLSSMAVRSLLITVLVIAIYIALNAPGHGAPEAVAAICLAVLLGVPLLTGYAQWWEILLVLIGLVLLAVEIFVIPGFGVMGVSGILLIMAGLVMTFVPREPPHMPGVLPSLQATRSALATGVFLVVSSLTLALLVCAILARYLPGLPLFDRLVLTRTVGGGVADTNMAHEDPNAVAARAPVVVGEGGMTLTDLRPGGTAQFVDAATGRPRNVDVVSDSGFVAARALIVVHALRGAEVVVRKSTSDSGGAAEA